MLFFFFKQKTAYEMRISDWSSDVCSSDLGDRRKLRAYPPLEPRRHGRAAVAIRRWPDARDAGPDRRRPIHHHGRRGPDAAPDGQRERHPRRRLDLQLRHALPHRYGERGRIRSEEHTSEIQSLMRISYAVFCLKKKIKN